MKLPYRKKLQTLAISASLIVASCFATPGIALAHGHHHHGGRHWHRGGNAVGVGFVFGAAAITMAAVAASQPRVVYTSNCYWKTKVRTRCRYDVWGNTICRPVRISHRVCYN